MKKIDINDENVKETIHYIIFDILRLHKSKTKTFFRINEDGELDLDFNFTENYHFPIPTAETDEFMKVVIDDIRPDEVVECRMNIKKIMNKYGEDYYGKSDFCKEYLEVEQKMIEETASQYIINKINQAIEEYNNKQGI